MVASVVTGEVVSLIEDDATDSDNNEDIDSDHSSSSMIVTGSSTENIHSSTTSKASASTGNDRVVSLLDKLKRPTPADIARRRKVKTNPSPVSNKCQCRGTSSSPKTIMPHQ